MPLEIGAVFAGFLLERELGRGGMGVVYLASNVITERRVALKVLTPELARDAQFRERFKRESRLAARLEHQHVIPLHHAGEEDGLLYLVMRFVDGTDLRSVLAARGALDPGRAVQIVAEVGGALDTAHADGLIHRDVKPENVLIEGNGDGRAYLTDFGLVKQLSSDSALTESGVFMGTYHYAAPEQFDSHSFGPPSARTDIYALGCVLYHCLTGRVPYPRDTPGGVVAAHMFHDPPDLREARPDLPAGLADVVQRALAKQPKQRYGTAGELAEAAGVALLRAQAERAATERADARERAAAERAEAERQAAERARVEREAAERAEAERKAAERARVEREAAERAEAERKAAERAAERQAAERAEAAQQAAERARVEQEAAEHARSKREAATPAAAEREAAAVERATATSQTTAEDRADLRPDRRRRLFALLLTGAAAIAVAAIVFLLTRSGPPAEVVRSIPVGNNPQSLAVGEGAVWVANYDAATVTRIDPRTGKATGSPIDVGNGPSSVAVGDGNVWVTNSEDDTVTRIDAGTGKVVGEPIDVGDFPISAAVGEGRVWVVNSLDKTVTQIDASSGKAVSSSIELGAHPIPIAAADGSVWVADNGGSTVTRLDIEGTEPVVGARINVEFQPSDIAIGEGAIWVRSIGGKVERIDPTTEKVRGAPTRIIGGTSVTAGEGGVWVNNAKDNTVVQLDPSTAEPNGSPVKVGPDPGALAVGEGHVWVANPTKDTVIQLRPTGG